MKKIFLIILAIGCMATVIGGGSMALFSDTESSQGNIFTAGTWQIEAGIRIEPEVLNLDSHGLFTIFITLPEGYYLEDIDLYTVECEGAFAVEGYIAGKKYIAKFDRDDLIGVPLGDEVVLTVTGELVGGTLFFGSDTITVK